MAFGNSRSAMKEENFGKVQAEKVKAFCHEKDLVCNGDLEWDGWYFKEHVNHGEITGRLRRGFIERAELSCSCWSWKMHQCTALSRNTNASKEGSSRATS